MSDLTKKQAELKQLQSTLENRKKGKKSKKVSFKKNHKMSYDASKGIYENLKKKSSKSLTDDEKKFLKDYDQIQTYDQIIRTYEKKIAELKKAIAELKKAIAELKKAIAELKKNGAKASATKTHPHPIKVERCKITKCPTPKKTKQKKTDELPGGKICITIDHLDAETLPLAKKFSGAGIPVTVFVKPAGAFKKWSGKIAIAIKGVTEKNRHMVQKFRPEQIKIINALKQTKNVHFGVHLLGRDNVQGLPDNVAKQFQIDNINYIKSIIGNVSTASYHGSNAGKVASTHIPQVQNAFVKIRGTSTTKTNNSIKYTTVDYSTSAINRGKVTHFFFHAKEYNKNKILINKLITGVKKGTYIPVPY